MRLRRLVVRGFKSFADRTEFDFDADLTGIVGPNGCGKSNVVDSLKWVLGDQRARSLRGKEMTDVIFKGAEGRDGMSQAEVEITLEDPLGRLDGRSEVRIGRRLNSEKESEYLLNGEVGRLKDIRDFLLDTGLGVGAYSVMEQGRIDAVLSANPEDRRAIFEEAAGISRYKLQKRETLRRLERTEQNLARVRDLLEERGKRVRSLKIQAGKARRFREVRVKLCDLRAALAVLDARAVRLEQERLAAALAAASAELQEFDRQREAAELALGAIEASIGERTESHEAASGRLHESRAERDACLARAAQKRLRATELDRDAQDAAARREGLAAQRQERTTQLAAARARLIALETEIVAVHRELEASRQAVQEASRHQQGLAAARERARNAVLEWVHVRTRLRNRAHEEETQVRQLDARERRLAERAEALQGELNSTQNELAQLALALEGLARDRDARQEEVTVSSAELELADREAAALNAREAELRGQQAALRGRLQALESMERELAGLDDGPRFLLREQPAGLRGRLLDRVAVDLELGAALEAALGPFVQALLVDTRANAEAMLGMLRARSLGRALLLVEEELERDYARGAATGLELPAGAAPLRWSVRHPADAENLVQWLLRGVCVVASLDAAPAERADLCFVTPAGDLRCGPRIEGGLNATSQAPGGLVVRRAQIAQLGSELAVVDAELAALQAGKDAAAGRVAILKTKVRDLAGAVQAVVGSEQEARAQIARHDGRRSDLEREREVIQLERDDVAAQRWTAIALLGRHLLDVHLAGRVERQHAAEDAAATQALHLAQAALADATGVEQALKMRQVAATSERDAQAAAIALHDQALLELAHADQDLASRGGEARAGAERALEDAVRAEAEALGLEERLQVLQGEREQAAAALAQEQARRVAQREELQRLEQERQTRREAHTSLRLGAGEQEHRFARLEEKLRDETAIELRRILGEIEGEGLVDATCALPEPPADTEVLQGPPIPASLFESERGISRLWLEPEFAVEPARQEAIALEQQLERLGPVNHDAVHELEEEERGFVFLDQQVKDLTEARTSLMETMRKLELESRALFEKTFEQARLNFHDIFRKLFQGGRADMQLIAGEDMLEAGIEIVARPPGKELQSINLLSGGERSLTALAILFAVFKVKPSPFCILDEVDAALDETNVERFLRVLQDFVGPTQFCVVTHHKRTMAACQVLYGITMQKKGVSSRIAVSLDEVDGLKAPGAATPLAAENRLAGADLKMATRQRIAGEEPIGF